MMIACTRRQPTMESLEIRQMFSASAPVVFTTQFESSDFGGTTGTAQRIEVSPMMSSTVSGQFSSPRDLDTFALSLHKGQLLLADADARLYLRKRGGRLITHRESSLAYRAPKSGTYYLQLRERPSTQANHAYTLSVLPIGLETGKENLATLDTTGGMYAFRRGTTLSISGPTGHGFSLIGNWKQKIVHNSLGERSIYTVTGSVTLRTIAGDIKLPIPSPLAMTINSDSRQFGRYYGEVTGIDWEAQLGLLNLSTPFSRSFGLSLANDFASLSSNARGWGVRLGSDPLLKNTGLPLDPAVPYLFYTDYRGFETSFGGVNLSAADSAGASVVVDPSDSLFIGAKGVPVVGDVAFGMSYHGLIPFTPNAKPTGWHDSLFGNVFIKGGLNIGDIQPEIPVNIDGDITIDLDANNDGKNLGGLKSNISQIVAHHFSARSLGRGAARVFGDIAIAGNGQVSFGYEKKGFDLSVPMGESSVIFSGPRGALFAHGATAQPFKGTPLSFIRSPLQADVDGYLDTKGNVRLTLSGAANVFNYRLANTVTTLDNSGVRMTASLRALGANATLNGSISSSGGLRLTGSANASLGGVIAGRANFALSGGSHGVGLAASLSARVGTYIGKLFVGGSADGSFRIGADSSGTFSYAGNAAVSLGIGPAKISPEVRISQHQIGFRAYVFGIIDHWFTLNLS